jgi:hypothetical protein
MSNFCIKVAFFALILLWLPTLNKWIKSFGGWISDNAIALEVIGLSIIFVVLFISPLIRFFNKDEKIGR